MSVRWEKSEKGDENEDEGHQTRAGYVLQNKAKLALNVEPAVASDHTLTLKFEFL